MDWERKGRPKASIAATHRLRSNERDESPSPQIISPPLSDSGRITPSLQTPPISRSVQSYYSELDEKRMHEADSLIWAQQRGEVAAAATANLSSPSKQNGKSQSSPLSSQDSQPLHPDMEAEMRRNVQRKQTHFVEASSSEDTSYDTNAQSHHHNSKGLSFASSPADAAAAVAKMGAASMTPANDSIMPSLLPNAQNVGEELTAEMKKLYSDLQKCLELREKYMDISLQGKWQDNPKNWDAEYCQTWARENGKSNPEITEKSKIKVDGSALGDDQKTPKPWRVYPAPPRPHWERFEPAPASSFVVRPTSVNPLPPAIPSASPANANEAQALLEATGSQPGVFNMQYVRIPGQHTINGSNTQWKMDDSGVIQVFASEEEEAQKPMFKIPTIAEYFKDLDYLLSVISDGPTKSYAWRRLKYLDGKWNLYILLNEYQELADMKRVPHRDFYNVRKVDTHIHHSASMNQKHLLRFIKAKIKRYPDDVVIYRDGKHLTLQQVFESLNLTAYDLSIDTLDMHAHQDSFHRFDKFNLKYNPIGESRLREIFLKTDNHIKGRYLAEITRELMNDLEQSKYQFAEYRISIYGRNKEEWDKLAAWVVDNNLFSNNVRWLIQVPRLYDVYKANGTLESFQQLLENVFVPLFEVTQNPQSHPKLHIFLQRVIGFDMVDDESKPERRIHRKFPVPRLWTVNESPPYNYWIYYMYANISSVNRWRQMRGFNTFVFRPHAGEAGDTDHMASCFLAAQSISHGILLRKVPVLQYLYYLKQVGMAMSPLSNNALFLSYDRNPFPAFLRVGMNVSISTDDPLQFHLSKEPLLEEYSVATQIYKLRPSDMCELARNSVLQSGFETELCRHWLGPKYYLRGPEGNVVAKSNVPDIRLRFRQETLKEELDLIWKHK
ncbi:hypothetical protein L7F22_039114 [Adiantum nelumboides]|nr:hypothetical protein [Adiantum nelumboides]